MPQYLKDHGEALVRLGYTVVPIKPGSKRPDIKNWPSHETTAADVVAWYSNGRANHGVGINARNTPAIDVDVMDPVIADRVSEAIDRIFPGVRLLTRTGLAPKFLIPFRSDQPFRKMTSKVYTDGKHEHKVEILGDGQQWVAYHVHPGTGDPYKWFDGTSDDGLRSVERSSLPVLARADAQRVIDAFELLAADTVACGRWVAKVSVERERSDTPTEDPFDAQPVGKSEPEVARLLKQLPNEDADYDWWFNVLAAVHHELGDAGRELAYEWSCASQKHTDEKFDRTWGSLGRFRGKPVTLRLLMKRAKEKLLAGVRASAGFVKASQFISDQKVEWHIKHVIPKRGLVVIYGAPGSSKSFFALDMVAHVARGIPWRGHRVRQSSVAYIAAEGVAGFGNRLSAYARYNALDMDGVPLFVRGGSFLLKDQTIDLVEELKALPDVGVVVIDTLAAVTPGANENTSEDMGLAISSAQLIIEATGATVILIHHTNKNGDMRGWSGLLGAVDNQIRIERKDNVRTAHVEKQKEGEDGRAYGYSLKVVDLYEDEDGDMVTSCVVVESDETAPNTRGERKVRSGDFETSDNYAKARYFLQVIEELVGLGDANVDEDDVIAAIQADPRVNPMGEQDHPKKANIKRTLLTLADKGKIRKEGLWIRVCR